MRMHPPRYVPGYRQWGVWLAIPLDNSQIDALIKWCIKNNIPFEISSNMFWFNCEDDAMLFQMRFA